MSNGLLVAKKKKVSLMKIKGLIPLYLFILPGLILVIIFNYIPMVGLQLAFKEWDFSGGIWGSPWIGLDNFRTFFNSIVFWRAIENTVILTFSRLILTFPAPILMAILLNEIFNKKFKRSIQTISYLPHFISWIIVAGILHALLSINGGAVNSLLAMFGIEPIRFMASEFWFRIIFLVSSVWKTAGWGSILYLAAISNIKLSSGEKVSL